MSGPVPIPVVERIARSVFITQEGCWAWQLYVKDNGYGNIGISGKTVLAHRASFTAFRGEVPKGLDLDHQCHTKSCSEGTVCSHRSCVNPWHLEPSPRSDNVFRGRNSRRLRTHCSRNHEYTEENTYTAISKNGRPYRRCRTCRQTFGKG